MIPTHLIAECENPNQNYLTREASGWTLTRLNARGIAIVRRNIRKEQLARWEMRQNWVKGFSGLGGLLTGIGFEFRGLRAGHIYVIAMGHFSLIIHRY